MASLGEYEIPKVCERWAGRAREIAVKRETARNLAAEVAELEAENVRDRDLLLGTVSGNASAQRRRFVILPDGKIVVIEWSIETKTPTILVEQGIKA